MSEVSIHFSMGVGVGDPCVEVVPFGVGGDASVVLISGATNEETGVMEIEVSTDSENLLSVAEVLEILAQIARQTHQQQEQEANTNQQEDTRG